MNLILSPQLNLHIQFVVVNGQFHLFLPNAPKTPFNALPYPIRDQNFSMRFMRTVHMRALFP